MGLRPTVLGDFPIRAVVAQPLSLPGDANRNDLIFLWAQMGEDGVGRLEGDGIFAGIASKQNGNGFFHIATTSFQRGSAFYFPPMLRAKRALFLLNPV